MRTRAPVVCSRRLARALTATSKAPLPAPAATSAAASASVECARPGNAAPAANAAHIAATAPPPKRSTARPARSIVGTEPTANPTSASPSVAFDACVCCWIAGSTAAHAPQKAPNAAKAACVTAALRRMWKARPLRIRAPVLPARRPRLCRDHALPFGADRGRLVLREDAEHLRLGEVALVLPAPRSVGIDDDVERLVARVEDPRTLAQRLLEVHVPAAKAPLLVPKKLDGVRVTAPDQLQYAAALPRMGVRVVASRPPLEVTAAVVGDDAVGERPADPAVVHAPHLDDFAGQHQMRVYGSAVNER